jgi:hypothetical protein
MVTERKFISGIDEASTNSPTIYEAISRYVALGWSVKVLTAINVPNERGPRLYVYLERGTA